MQFEKYLFNISLNNISVAKYFDEESVQLRVEKEGSKVRGSSVVSFDSEEDFQSWIDGIVDDQTATYNHAAALNNVLNVMQCCTL